MKMFLKLAVFLSAAALFHAAPTTVEEITTETTPNAELLTDLKTKSIDSKDSLASTIFDDIQQKLNPDEIPIIKEIVDKLDKSDITKIIDEEMALKTKNSADGMMTSEATKSGDTKQTTTENEAEDFKNKLSTNTMLKKSDTSEYIKKITEETDKQLKDVASAVAEVVTSLPIPGKPDTPSKYTEVIGHFVSDLLQIPMLLLHAVSNAIATLTNNKVNIPTPTFLVPVSQAPPH